MPADPAPIAVRLGAHQMRLKWHRARRRADDVPFTAARIAEGMTAGASVEVDLRIHRDRGFAILHDDALRGATDGRGRVHRSSAARLRTLHLRDADGEPTRATVQLLDDLPPLFARRPPASGAVLQLDFKQDARALDEAAVAAFVAATESIAPHLILSCGDARAVQVLTDAVPAMAVGYDPCHHGAADAVRRSGDFAGFVERACLASPRASTVYLELPLLLTAADRGVDLVDAFAQRGRLVDAYTLGGRVNHGWLPIVDRLLSLRTGQLTTDDAQGLAELIG